MINKLKQLVKENRYNQQLILAHAREAEWASVYHDSIRGKAWLENLPLNIGRWAGNYAFFYVLHRILDEYKPLKILDLGLGESSKFISTYIKNQLHQSIHHIVEQDNNWLLAFQAKFELTANSTIYHCPLTQLEVNGNHVNSYQNFEETIKGDYDLYLVDGPLGSPRYSRYQITSLLNRLNTNKQFILVLDDYNREGEKDTAQAIRDLLNKKGITFYEGVYEGSKSLLVIATSAYRFTISM